MIFCHLLFFFKSTFWKNSFRNIIRVSNSLDHDQARHFVDNSLCQCYLLITFVNSLDTDQTQQNIRLDLDPYCCKHTDGIPERIFQKT